MDREPSSIFYILACDTRVTRSGEGIKDGKDIVRMRNNMLLRHTPRADKQWGKIMSPNTCLTAALGLTHDQRWWSRPKFSLASRASVGFQEFAATSR